MVRVQVKHLKSGIVKQVSARAGRALVRLGKYAPVDVPVPPEPVVEAEDLSYQELREKVREAGLAPASYKRADLEAALYSRRDMRAEP